ncbi:MAG: Phosphoribosylformimino-5-aminoimidazole carboxamide ribotide isomerase [Firmicutes bacterium]|nr:Phosphoribosylformimino-5-aminoimidazole carboxamide ribotide isomerase [Bacillota bacterium]MDI6705539.1 1-(5-phosphoribosyl)-5-[(5-phosphoribosylamino)methylideneamino]imidazole-4-carboxamide isomerase [Bacillota bacterium]
MIVYPAIDIKNGECVRLIQGDMERATTYYKNPAAAALRWQNLGAEHLHVVDLDGAVSGKPHNTAAIKEILDAVSIPIQLGGGIRDLETVEMALNMGVERVIIGTAALKDEAFIRSAVCRYGSRIVIGIDARDGCVAVEGWKRTSRVRPMELAKRMEAYGAERVVYTDISRDGMLEGPSFGMIEEMVKQTSMSIIASGGISSVDDLLRLREIGAGGAVVGKALYAGSIDLKEALDILRR